MKIKTYIINLKESTERREYVLAEVGKFKFPDIEIVDAVDGREMSESEKQKCFDIKRFWYIEKRYPLPGEIGCTLSHRECYRRLLNSKEEFALILEDDVRFLAKEETVESLLKEAIGKIPNRPYIMTLSRHMIYYPKSEYQVGQYSFCRVYHAWGTCAYLINRKGAEVMQGIGKAYYVADDYREMARLGIWVHGIYPMLAIGKSEMGEILSSVQDEKDMDPDMKPPLFYRMRDHLLGKIRGFLFRLSFLKLRKDYMKIIDTGNS